jgi:hypothetical protein
MLPPSDGYGAAPAHPGGSTSRLCTASIRTATGIGFRSVLQCGRGRTALGAMPGSESSGCGSRRRPRRCASLRGTRRHHRVRWRPRENPELREQFLEEGDLSDLDEAADRRGIADCDHPDDNVWMSSSRSSVVYPAGILRSPRRRSNARRDHPAKRHALATGRSPSATRWTANSLRKSLSTLRRGGELEGGNDVVGYGHRDEATICWCGRTDKRSTLPPDRRPPSRRWMEALGRSGPPLRLQ